MSRKVLTVCSEGCPSLRIQWVMLVKRTGTVKVRGRRKKDVHFHQKYEMKETFLLQTLTLLYSLFSFLLWWRRKKTNDTQLEFYHWEIFPFWTFQNQMCLFSVLHLYKHHTSLFLSLLSTLSLFPSFWLTLSLFLSFFLTDSFFLSSVLFWLTLSFFLIDSLSFFLSFLLIDFLFIYFFLINSMKWWWFVKSF